MKMIQEIKEKALLGDAFNAVIVDKDNGCSISLGFGFIPKSVLMESLDEFGYTIEDNMLSQKDAFQLLKSYKDDNFYEIIIEDMNDFLYA